MVIAETLLNQLTDARKNVLKFVNVDSTYSLYLFAIRHDVDVCIRSRRQMKSLIVAMTSKRFVGRVSHFSNVELFRQTRHWHSLQRIIGVLTKQSVQGYPNIADAFPDVAGGFHDVKIHDFLSQRNPFFYGTQS